MTIGVTRLNLWMSPNKFRRPTPHRQVIGSGYKKKIDPEIVSIWQRMQQ